MVEEEEEVLEAGGKEAGRPVLIHGCKESGCVEHRREEGWMVGHRAQRKWDGSKTTDRQAHRKSMFVQQGSSFVKILLTPEYVDKQVLISVCCEKCCGVDFVDEKRP